jgi:hypothetical protein
MPDQNIDTPQLIGRLREIVDLVGLDLSDITVLTEAATGAYAVTPAIAALAGARVTAFTRASRFGTVEDVRRQTARLANALDLANMIDVVDKLRHHTIASADIVTNSGHLRPLTAEVVNRMTPGAVIPLMYESWEFRAQDLDIEACRKRGIAVGGTNERHPKLQIFDYLGMLAIHGLLNSGVAVADSNVLLICNNPFESFIERHLLRAGARVALVDGSASRTETALAERTYDAIVLAATPADRPWLGEPGQAMAPAAAVPAGTVLVQIFGDIDREAFDGVRFYPAAAPSPGHMGVMLHDIGVEPVVRLQAGGLKAGECLLRRDSAIGLRDSFVDALLAPWPDFAAIDPEAAAT